MEMICFYIATTTAGAAFVELCMVHLGANPLFGSHKSSLESVIASGIVSVAFSCLHLITHKSSNR